MAETDPRLKLIVGVLEDTNIVGWRRRLEVAKKIAAALDQGDADMVWVDGFHAPRQWVEAWSKHVPSSLMPKPGMRDFVAACKVALVKADLRR